VVAYWTEGPEGGTAATIAALVSLTPVSWLPPDDRLREAISIAAQARRMDCFVAYAARNDDFWRSGIACAN